jgi:hypothetical protein
MANLLRQPGSNYKIRHNNSVVEKPGYGLLCVVVDLAKRILLYKDSIYAYLLVPCWFKVRPQTCRIDV